MNNGSDTFALIHYPKESTRYFYYGTAGFRVRAELMDFIAYRVGLLSALRSKALQGAAIGLMITASHNPEEDNGVKLIDPNGEMLETKWEAIAERLVNASSTDEVSAEISRIISTYDIKLCQPAMVMLGRDTRKSSYELSMIAMKGIQLLEGTVQNLGAVTTPQLHYFVRSFNTELISLKVDGANGIGALKMEKFSDYLEDILMIDVYNKGEGLLNVKCGADYVKMQQKAPIGKELIPFEKYASIDGDGDRIVYFYSDSMKFHLLDGDKIAVLYAKYFIELALASDILRKISVAVVQTGYANGSATKYLKDVLNVPVFCVATGVKNLHKEAKKYDVGIYFEANGHGTVLFSNELKKFIDEAASEKNCAPAVLRFQMSLKLVNEATGDALTNILLVESILSYYKWSIKDWDGLYADIPNCQIKVFVQDRNCIKTDEKEKVCIKPTGLQERIDDLAKAFPSSRFVIRPSGTEDVIRIYAEANTQENANKLAVWAAQEIFDFVGGVGKRPDYPSCLDVC